MRLIFKFHPLVLLVIFLFGCSNVPAFDCSRFKYDLNVKEHLIIPKMAREVGEFLQYYDIDNPSIWFDDGKVEVIISSGLPDKDKGYVNYVSDVSHVFVYDCTESEFVSYYEVE